MFANLPTQPEDKILGLMAKYAADPRTDKIDLGVGVYKNADGITPIMGAIKTAEKQLWEVEITKSYTGLGGDPAFSDAMISLVLGNAVARDQVAAVATPGGTGAVRQALELLQLANPQVTVWVSDPTWPNHLSILKHLGIETRSYRYFDSASRSVDFGAMMADLVGVGPNDVVLLHGCCHNPTGANLNATQWEEVIAHLAASGAMPFIDIAYQGFGEGLEEDALAVRAVASKLPETVIAASCSKNFGIYRERTGVLMAVGDSARQTVTQGNLAHLNRQNFSFPPDHGARLVTMILNDDALRADWAAELESMRTSMLDIRQTLADTLREVSGSDRFGFIAEHRGMFSRVGASPEQVDRMRDEHGVYMVGDSRINIAGVTKANIPALAKAIVDVGV